MSTLLPTWDVMECFVLLSGLLLSQAVQPISCSDTHSVADSEEIHISNDDTNI